MAAISGYQLLLYITVVYSDSGETSRGSKIMLRNMSHDQNSKFQKMKMVQGCHFENGLYLIHESSNLYEVWNAELLFILRMVMLTILSQLTIWTLVSKENFFYLKLPVCKWPLTSSKPHKCCNRQIVH